MQLFVVFRLLEELIQSLHFTMRLRLCCLLRFLCANKLAEITRFAVYFNTNYQVSVPVLTEADLLACCICNTLIYL